MDAWRTLKVVIPDGQVKAVAARMHVSYDYVLRWRREPLSDEAPFVTGQVSPLARCCALIDAAFLVNPKEASLIVEHVCLHFELLTRAHGIDGFHGSCRERAQASADLLTLTTDAVVALSVKGVSDETLRKLVILREAANTAISRVGKDLAAASGAHV